MTRSKEEVQAVLQPYQDAVNEKLSQHFDAYGPDTPLKKVCRYAVMNGGKRLRPVIALMVAEALGKGFDSSGVALAIELFHCASLVADDLPCMDDDDLRRDVPSTHKAFGEGLALLASYTLIADGYGSISRCWKDNPELEGRGFVCAKVLENAARNTGIFGATGGQFLDVFPPEKLSENAIRQVIQQKTVSLFEIAFVGGWLFGGGSAENLSQVEALAHSFGMAFQIADDLGDVEQDKKNDRAVNFPARLGVEKAQERLHDALDCYKDLLTELGIASDGLSALADLVLLEAEKYAPALA